MREEHDDLEESAFTWVRCRSCHNGLWRLYPDHLEMVIRVRGGGQHRTISAPLSSTVGLRVLCEKCGALWESDGASETPLISEGTGADDCA